MIPAILRAHLEGPDHLAVIGPRPAKWEALHRHLHLSWRMHHLSTNHEQTQPPDHDINVVHDITQEVKP